MLELILISSVVVVVLAGEAFWHRRARHAIPVRIHVNGIRGKSSVVRLVAAGLRAGGMPTWAKVTGTMPSVVDEAGVDVPIDRGAPPSIIEQRAVIAEAAAAGIKALVIECMALDPAFQRADESLIKPTISVITNVRLDHEEVFGSSLLDIALALSNTMPDKGVMVTTSGEGVSVLQAVADRKRTRLVVVDTGDLDDSLAEGFTYIEHKENVALALAICEEVGVPPDVALHGMRSCQGDPGALRILRQTRGGKVLNLINAMAANDPESTLLLYQRIVLAGEFAGPVLVLVNSRKDRPLRSRQLGRLLPDLPADRYFLIGDDSDAVLREAAGAGISGGKMEKIAAATPEDVVAKLYSAIEEEGVVFAMGNTAGLGLEVADHFAGAAAPQMV